MSWSTQEWWLKRFFIFNYRAITFYGLAFQQVLLTKNFLTLLNLIISSPYNLRFNLRQNRFGLFPFRSPLLREFRNVDHRMKLALHLMIYILLFGFYSFGYWNVLLPQVHFLHQVQDLSNLLERGYPIRTSPDQRLLGTSPKLIAAMLRPSSSLQSQGIHHMLLNFLLGNLKTTFT